MSSRSTERRKVDHPLAARKPVARSHNISCDLYSAPRTRSFAASTRFSPRNPAGNTWRHRTRPSSICTALPSIASRQKSSNRSNRGCPRPAPPSPLLITLLRASERYFPGCEHKPSTRSARVPPRVSHSFHRIVRDCSSRLESREFVRPAIDRATIYPSHAVRPFAIRLFPVRPSMHFPPRSLVRGISS